MKHSVHTGGRAAFRIFLTLLVDLLLIGIGLCLFALFHHVLPQRFDAEELYSEGKLEELEKDLPNFEFTPSGMDSDVSDASSGENENAEDVSSPSDDVQDEPMTAERLFALTEGYKRYDATVFENRTVTPLYAYVGQSAMLSLSCHTFGQGDDLVTYYAADVYLSSATAMKAYVCTDERGKVCDGDIEAASEDAGAIFMVNTDYFKSRSWGYYIRNGVKYLTAATKNDLCVLYLDGTMEVIYGGSAFLDLEAAAEKGIWQMFTFGPSLFDEEGNPYTDASQMNITSTYNLSQDKTSIYGFQSPNPRTAIGYIEPGHYLLVTVDGRKTGYSRGATLQELAAILFEEGAVLAYNLDGGGSSQMFFDGESVNFPASGRSPSDYLYLAAEENALIWKKEGEQDI